jgi:hypothetical protein
MNQSICKFNARDPGRGGGGDEVAALVAAPVPLRQGPAFLQPIAARDGVGGFE